MVVPALIFVAFNAGGPASHGWGIPMATDIAFAVGVMAVLGRRVPAPLKVLPADAGHRRRPRRDRRDRHLLQRRPRNRVPRSSPSPSLLVVAGLRRIHVTYPPLFVIAGIALWVVIFESGVHATIAGVMMGLLTPARPCRTSSTAEAVVDVLENRAELSAEDVRATAAAIKDSVSVCDRLIDLLHPWTSYLIVPVFALANAGIALGAQPARRVIDLPRRRPRPRRRQMRRHHHVRLAGDPTRLAGLPPGVTWGTFAAAGMLAGIGFTVSLFITGLAFNDDTLADPAKVGILLASVTAAAAGSAMFIALARGRGRVARCHLRP